MAWGYRSAAPIEAIFASWWLLAAAVRIVAEIIRARMRSPLLRITVLRWLREFAIH
jgi:hypothetical protein